MSPIETLVLAHAPRRQMADAIAAMCARPDVECYYFGRLGSGGHAVHRRRGRAVLDAYDEERVLTRVFGSLDQSLCWNGPQAGERYGPRDRDETEGLAYLTHRTGDSGDWTAVAFWDRTGDQRFASNSVFITRGHLTFAQAVRVARTVWPEVWARFTFPIVQVDSAGRRIG